MNNSPLVSIVVITYNSSKYVLETLESAKNQTYKNIELIISDDCSKDDTVAICRDWISANSNRFVRTEIVKTPVNTGIPANCNRGFSASQGEWIKVIAGDDLLLSNCITDNVNHIQENCDIQILFSKIEYLSDNKDRIIKLENIFDYNFFGLDASSQADYLIEKENCVPASTQFINKKIFQSFQFDERIKLIEDYPYWITLTRNRIRLHLLNNKTVAYRLHESNTSSTPNKNYIMSHFQVFRHYIMPYYFQKHPFLTVHKLLRFGYYYTKSSIKESLSINKRYG